MGIRQQRKEASPNISMRAKHVYSEGGMERERTSDPFPSMSCNEHENAEQSGRKKQRTATS